MLRHLTMTVCGLGQMKPAPGTWGSLPPCVMAAAGLWFGFSPMVISLVLLAVLIGSCVGCVAFGKWAEERFHGKDPGVVVIDEVAGMALTLMFIPLIPVEGSGAAASVDDPRLFGLVVIAAAFFLFRLLDIVKPQPANLMQQFPAGWGILLDDLVAGVYANVLIQLFLRLGLPLLVGSGP